MKKPIIKYCFLFIVFFTSLTSYSQNWLPLDKGIGKPWADIHHIFPDSNGIYVSGNFTEDGNNISMRGIAKWDGVKWDSVGNANEFNATKDAIYKYHGSLMTSTIFNDWPHTSLAKLNGNVWEPFSNSRDLNIKCFLEKDGILYMGGAFDVCGSDSTFGLAKFDGTTFSAMTPCYIPHTAQILSLAFFQDTLYVGGNFNLYPQLPINGLAKWNGTDLLPVSSEFLSSACTIEALTVFKNELYIGGLFWKSNGFKGDCIMKWDGHQLSEVGGGANQDIVSMKVYNNELYVAGRFTEIGGIISKNIAKWDGNNWISLNIEDFDNFNCIHDICIYKEELYVAGIFKKIGNDSISSIAKYNHPLVSSNDISVTENHFTIYPNPASETATLLLPVTDTEKYNLKVFDIAGRLIIEENNISGKNHTLKVSALKQGVYFVEVIGNAFTGVVKMVVQ